MNKLKYKLSVIVALSAFTFGTATISSANTLGGWLDLFNVYSTGSISYYYSDFQGIAGAQNDFIASNFHVNDKGDVGPYSLYAGGSVNLNETNIWNGGIYAGGNVTLQRSWLQQGNIVADNNISIIETTIGQNDVYGFKQGSLFAGSNATLTNFYVNGDVSATGTAMLTEGWVEGAVSASDVVMVSAGQSGVPFSLAIQPTINLNDVSNFFKTASTNIGSQTSTIIDGFFAYNPNNTLSLTLQSGDNYFTMTNEQFLNIWGVDVYGPNDAKLYVNVLNENGENVFFDWVMWEVSGGMSLDDILVNFPYAENISFIEGSNVDLLMPFATTRFDNGLLTGSLITGDLYGGYVGNDSMPGGQVNLPPSVPEPAAVVLLWLGMMGLASLRRIVKT